LFAVHGLLRFPFVGKANESGNWFFTIALGLAFLLTSVAIAYGMFVGDTLGKRWMTRWRESRCQ